MRMSQVIAEGHGYQPSPHSMKSSRPHILQLSSAHPNSMKAARSRSSTAPGAKRCLSSSPSKAACGGRDSQSFDTNLVVRIPGRVKGKSTGLLVAMNEAEINASGHAHGGREGLGQGHHVLMSKQPEDASMQSAQDVEASPVQGPSSKDCQVQGSVRSVRGSWIGRDEGSGLLVSEMAEEALASLTSSPCSSSRSSSRSFSRSHSIEVSSSPLLTISGTCLDSVNQGVRKMSTSSLQTMDGLPDSQCNKTPAADEAEAPERAAGEEGDTNEATREELKQVVVPALPCF